MVIAYVRVSTNKQHLDNQKEEILRFADGKNIEVDRWLCEVVNGRKSRHERGLSDMLSRLRRGDTLIVTELSRLSRTMLEIMGILNMCMEKQITLYSTKDGYAFEDNINSKVLGFAFGLVAEIERNLISQRTKEALMKRKLDGQVLGRPKGSLSGQNKLKGNMEHIMKMRQEKHSYVDIAKTYGVSRGTLYAFMKEQTDKAKGSGQL